MVSCEPTGPRSRSRSSTKKATDPDTAHFAQQASLQEAAGYSNREHDPRPYLTRIEEVCAFARRMGYQKLSLAFCAGLIEEARLLDEVLTAQGIEVVSEVSFGTFGFKYYGREKDLMELYTDLPRTRGAAACGTCPGTCEGSCPFGRRIRPELVEAHEALSFRRA